MSENEKKNDDTTENPLVFSEKSDADQENENQVKLKREVTLLGGISVIVGSMIGSGIFISPVGVLKNIGSIGGSLIVWLCCGLVATFGSLTYAELGTMIPRSGAEYPYLLEAFGPIPAFLFVWTSSIVLKPSAVGIIVRRPAVARLQYMVKDAVHLLDTGDRALRTRPPHTLNYDGLVFGEYLIRPFFSSCDEVPLTAIKLASAGCICLVTFINCYSMKVAQRLQIVFTIAKLGALAIIIVAGAVALGFGYTDNLETAFDKEFSLSTVGTAFYQGLWAFDGWNQLNYITEELQNPYVNLPRAILIGIPSVTGIYILTNMAYYSALNMAELLGSRAVAVTFGIKMLGVMSWIIPLGVAISTFGGVNGYTITGPRIIYTAARNGHTPDILAMVNVKRVTPVPAILFNSLISILVTLPNDFDSLVNYFSFAMWLFHGSSAVALLYMRYTKPDVPRPFKVPIVIPVLVVIFAAFLVLYPIISNPAWEYLYAALFIVGGLIFYFPFIHYKVQMPGSKTITICLQKLLQVVPTESSKTS